MERVCRAEGCSRTDIKGKGYCSMHWQRIRKNGSLVPKILKNGPRMEYPEEYKSWASMRDRCLNKSATMYKYYGGKGIKICERWLELPNGFPNFLEDMGPKPNHDRTPNGGKPVWSLDRIDPNKDYCKENCRWANWLTQEGNKSIISGKAGVVQVGSMWKARHRTSQAVLSGTFATKEMAEEAKEYWTKKYPA